MCIPSTNSNSFNTGGGMCGWRACMAISKVSVSKVWIG